MPVLETRALPISHHREMREFFQRITMASVELRGLLYMTSVSNVYPMVRTVATLLGFFARLPSCPRC